jgi:hypothetical protein
MTRAILMLAAMATAFAATPALAAERMISFEPVSPDARRLTGAGITVLFTDRLVGQRVNRLLATAIPAQANLKRASARVLGGLRVENLGELYAIDDKAAQGAVYVRAFCPGSKQAWLAFSRVGRGELTVQALGDDPAATGAARLCATMTFRFKGEWNLPPRTAPDPMEETRDLVPF